jgi:hypothetical protein
MLFDIGGKDAAQSAKRYAMNDLERKLQNEFEVVHCPDCGMYPPQISKYIYEQRRGTPLIKALMVVVVLVGLFICAVISSITPSLSLVVFGLTVIAVAAIYFVLNKKADDRIASYDPNRNASQRRGMPFSEEYPVLRRSDLEQLAKRFTTTSNLHIDIPTW